MTLYLIIIVPSLTLQGQDVQHYLTLAKDAYQKKDFESYYNNLQEANKLYPYHSEIQYRLGAAAALTNRPEDAFVFLRMALMTNATLDLIDNNDLSAIRDRTDFTELLTLQNTLLQPIIHSDTAFVLKDRALHSEGIEYEPTEKAFYIGSIHQRKIVKVDSNGKVTDFCPIGFEGMTSVFGLKIDLKSNILWACSSPVKEMINYDSTMRSAVFKFDLKSGGLIRKIMIPDDKPDGMFGDLILTAEGNVLVSDSRNNHLYQVNESTSELELFFTSSEFWSIQGLAFTCDENYLFISDYVKGVFRVDVRSKELILLSNSTYTSLNGIDGLYFYKGSLITIQNGITPNCVSKYQLDKEMKSVTSCQIIDRAHPAFGEPTLGVLFENTFYYIANSQWNGYRDGKQKPTNQLRDIVILKISLN